eukprot:gene19874-26573_t
MHISVLELFLLPQIGPMTPQRLPMFLKDRSYDSTETAYVLEGLVVVTPDDGEPVEIKAGDLCTFPAGMDCTWDVKKPINKHYNFS